MCNFVTCDNGGQCRGVDTPRCFTCDCKPGFTGLMCETKEEVVNTSRVFFI